MRTTLIVLGALLSAFLVFRWDYYLSQYLFEQVCIDSDLIGLHVYERDYIDRDHTRPQTKVNGHEISSKDAYFYDGTIAILKNQLDSRFMFQQYETIVVSNVGPITLLQSTLTRKSDGKVLGRATGAQNHHGWLVRASSFGYQKSYCPPIQAQAKAEEYDAAEIHLYLLSNALGIR